MVGYEAEIRCSIERDEATTLLARHSSGSGGAVGPRGDHEPVQGT